MKKNTSRRFKIAYHIMELKESGTVRSPDDICKLVSGDIKNELQECLMLIGLDVRNTIISKHLVAKGAHNRLQVTPREMLIPLLHNGCSNVILMHNHPSGSTSPSEEDIVFTKRADKAFKLMGMTFLDHVIVSGTGFYSFKKEGLI